VHTGLGIVEALGMLNAWCELRGNG
jgi:hypothetical protein